ncbi:class I SAM-dependent methyltransferase [Peredibacter starrii]|uniref:S-adenosyl-L-methionine-dependent methyltransferase n=1 Tax=Peredibacter starrii TaxID=28202 RepID=A0AAX4HN45_9BACT|nr:SAM-dependent methyltransferase [Peredibacter starrii]WPU64546.1 SAM-dependent methyltransferase [Peredibacter starrii]
MKQITIPDHTAVRVALWRAMHAQIDASPIFKDEFGLKLVAPDESWKERGDMHPQGTRGYRASIVGRARFIEDLLLEKINHGVTQYVILGSGLDTFAQRRPDIASKIKVFEIDEPQTQAWKKKRLAELDYTIPDYLKFVPVDFEYGESWLEKLKENGFKLDQPTYVVSTGVSMYLTREANLDTFQKVSTLASGSTLAMTFMLPPELVEPEDRVPYEMVMKRTAEAGTPFLSLFASSEAITLAEEAGLKDVRHVSRQDIIQMYFAGRPDDLKPSSGEEFLVVTT